MCIQKKITLRYRGEGHLRFEIPEQLCDQAVASLLTDKIHELESVYRVRVFRKQRKLSIHFQESICEFKLFANQLFQLFSELEQQNLLVAQVVNKINQEKPIQWNLKSRIKDLKVAKWAGEKYDDAKDTVKAAKIISKVGLKKPKAFFKDPEKAMIDFFNDILLLYLITLHWSRITKEWIPKPWVHRYEWTAVFYLFYLLMRSRKPKK
jgi:hypothetical protein